MARLPAIHDREGDRVPPGLQVNVHLFPDEVFSALWRWFDENAWPIRYRMSADQVVDFLKTRGVQRLVGLVYSHKPGMAAQLNEFAASIAAAHPQMRALGTVLPGEPGTRSIVRDALGSRGLAGIKIHCHVQCLAPDDSRLDPVYEEAAAANKPVLIHAGRGPTLEGYHVDVRELCSAAATSRALCRHPDTTVVVPHLGADEEDEFAALLAEHPRLYLDTTMMLGHYFGPPPDAAYFTAHANRVLFGTDFPNIPYAWDRELQHLLGLGLPSSVLQKILFDNADQLFFAGIDRA